MTPDLSIAPNRKRKWLPLLFLIAGGILINVVGAKLALYFRLPLFLDSIGTVLVAVIGGYMPGIAVGFLTNVLNGLADYTTNYYSSISVLIAICSAWMAGKGAFRRMMPLLAAVLVLALIGGGLGSILTWFLYGGGIGEGISAPLARSFYDSGRLSLFLSQLSADLLIDLLDKLLTVLTAALVLRLLPPQLLARFKPAQPDSSNGTASRKVRRISLRSKTLLMISASILLIAITVSLVSLSLFRKAIIEEKSKMALGIANTASTVFDHERVEEYLELGEDAPGYAESRKRLSDIMKSSDDVSFVYVYQIREDGCHVVFDPDTEDTPGEAPGSVIGFDEAFRPYLEDLLAGRPLSGPIISDETYGRLLTVYLPVYNEAGACQCYVGVDLSMSQLEATGSVFLVKILSLFFGFFILVLAIGAAAADYEIVQPVNRIAGAAGSFVAESDEDLFEFIDGLRHFEVEEFQPCGVDERHVADGLNSGLFITQLFDPRESPDVAVFIGDHSLVFRSQFENFLQIRHVFFDQIFDRDNDTLLRILQQIGIAETGIENQFRECLDVRHFKGDLVAPLVALNGLPFDMDVGRFFQALEDGAFVGIGLRTGRVVGQSSDRRFFLKREGEGCRIDISGGFRFCITAGFTGISSFKRWTSEPGTRLSLCIIPFRKCRKMW